MVRPKVIEFLSNNLLNKVQLILKCDLEKKDGYTDTTFFRSKQHSLLQSSDLEEVYDIVSKEIMKQFDEYMGRDSGVTLKWVQQLDTTLSKYNPLDLSGSSYILLPRKVALTKGVVNMKNKDEQCFKWSVTRFLNPVKTNGDRITPLLREQSKELNWMGVRFPTPVTGNSISNFEENNKMGVLVIGYDENEKYVPLRVPGAKYEKVVHLFYFSDGEKSHYACVGSISRLLSSSISKMNQKVNICHYCLSLVSKIGLEEHVRFCSKHEPMKVTMPEEGEKCYFKDYKSTMWLPVVIYADFETLHKKVDETHGQTKLISKHIPCAYSIVVVSDLPNFQTEPISYVGENAERKFVKDLENIRDKFHNKFARSRKMIFGSEERAKYDLQKECFACGEEFTFNHEKDAK